MVFALGPGAVEGGFRLAAYETIGSTSAEALARARGGDPGRLWIVASEQTQGHGRRGRVWHTPRGDLAASLLVPTTGHRTATLGFVAGLALESAIRAVAPALTRELRLKWPNDVLLNGAKVAGILLEAVSPAEPAPAVVVGIGVNVRHVPSGLSYPATSLAEAGAEMTAETLFTALSDAWLEHETHWDAGSDFAAIRDRWLARAAGLGAPIAVRLGSDVLRGTFETIDEEGRLVMRGYDGAARSVSAGDVYFGAAASAEL